MRYSVWKTDPGYANWAKHGSLNVYLNGELMTRVFTADTDLGEVIRGKVDAKGCVLLNGDEVATETLHGRVEVRP